MEDTTETYYSVKQTRDKETGKLLREEFTNVHGQFDRGELPSVIDYDPETGSPIEEKYFKDGLLHREGAPARVIRDPKSGAISEEFWYQNGMLHRDEADGIGAYIKWNLDPNHPVLPVGEDLISAHYENGEHLYTVSCK